MGRRTDKEKRQKKQTNIASQTSPGVTESFENLLLCFTVFFTDAEADETADAEVYFGLRLSFSFFFTRCLKRLLPFKLGAKVRAFLSFLAGFYFSHQGLHRSKNYFCLHIFLSFITAWDAKNLQHNEPNAVLRKGSVKDCTTLLQLFRELPSEWRQITPGVSGKR